MPQVLSANLFRIMKPELVSEVIDCLPKGKTHYRYYKGAYAPQLLSLMIERETSLRVLKQSRFKSLVEHPLVKSVAAQSGNGKLDPQGLKAIWEEPSQPFLLSLSRWGGKRDRGWFQTSRHGENLVLQLKEPLIKYKRPLQGLKRSATRRCLKLMAVVLQENSNNVDERFKPCPAGLSR